MKIKVKHLNPSHPINIDLTIGIIKKLDPYANVVITNNNINSCKIIKCFYVS